MAWCISRKASNSPLSCVQYWTIEGGCSLSIRRDPLAFFFAVSVSLCACYGSAQTPSLPLAGPVQAPSQPPSSPKPTSPEDLPDAPSSLPQQDVVVAAHSAFEATGDPVPLDHSISSRPWETDSHTGLHTQIQRKRALLLADQRFLNDVVSLPMTPRQKAFLAATNVADPGNLAVVALSSAIYTASNSHSPYGPGVIGFGKNYGYALSQGATGEFFGTWLIPTLGHQDPRYHRMPGAPIGKRILHALSHTLVSQHDDGSPMPNYATLLTYPISAEIANLYVPGLHTGAGATAGRVAIGLASDPSEALIGEFLPDVARRIHIRVTFFQQIINDISTEHPL